MKKNILLLVILVLSGMCFVGGCSNYKSTDPNSILTNGYAKTGPVYFMAGKIQAVSKADISSLITARVVGVNVDVGTTVKQGDPLIKLDSKELAAQLAQASAGLSQAQAAADGAQTSYTITKNTNDRNQALYNAGAISKAQLEQSQAELDAAQTALRSSQAQLNQTQASLELASTQLENGMILSPISGVVSARNINTGELALAGTVLLTVVNSTSLKVDAYLPSTLSGNINVGQEVSIKVSELPNQEFRGRISLINMIVEPNTNNILVEVLFLQENPLLKPGMFAEIGLIN
ncbi:MAG TPA: efflux RND transporter periplasmic adaptor subunit [Syntrophomonadaceae bacterium]|nr:efflux RND transporter periplasmic adaptor subunit [Syntrophomonadaceae bacterium]